MNRYFLAALFIGFGALLAHTGASRAQENPVTAIDIALEPDATMIQHAEAANARLLKVFPKGFSLDATHRPHISMLQRYVRTADLDKVYAAAGKVLADEKVTSWKLKAFKYYYIPWKDIGLGGIVVEPTDDLLRLQQELIDAVAPFTEKTGTAAAIVTTAEDPEINQPTIDYVAAFVPEATGKKFNRTSPSASHPRTTSRRCSPSRLMYSRSRQRPRRSTNSATSGRLGRNLRRGI